jgi:hypothetical protein
VLTPVATLPKGSFVNPDQIVRRQDAQELIDAMKIHYNFISRNQALGGQTPAGASGISLNRREQD